MTPLVRVLIADDDPLFMDAHEAILGIEAQIEIAGHMTGRRQCGSPASSSPTSSSWI